MQENTRKNFNSSELIELALKALGLERKNISTYVDFPINQKLYIRLRISDHGLILSTWVKKNMEDRKKNKDTLRLNQSKNIAISFSPSQEECDKKKLRFPIKIINKTMVKTKQGHNVKPQFIIEHYCYLSWLLTESETSSIIYVIKQLSQKGVYIEPLGLKSGKVLMWENISNLPPKKRKG